MIGKIFLLWLVFNVYLLIGYFVVNFICKILSENKENFAKTVCDLIKIGKPDVLAECILYVVSLQMILIWPIVIIITLLAYVITSIIFIFKKS